jgi:hypothetical protein
MAAGSPRYPEAARTSLFAPALICLAFTACSSQSPVPPTIMSGNFGAPTSGKGMPHVDAGLDADVLVIPTDGGPTQTVTCTYVAPGTTGTVCAIELGVPLADVSALETSCSGTNDGTPGTACSPDSLTGCCEPPASASSPTWVCYYPGDTENQASCQAAGGTWSATLP